MIQINYYHYVLYNNKKKYILRYYIYMELKNKFIFEDLYGFHLQEDSKYLIIFFKIKDQEINIINSISNFTNFIKKSIGLIDYSLNLSKVTLKLENFNIPIFYKDNKKTKENADEINQVIDIICNNEDSLNFLKA